VPPKWLREDDFDSLLLEGRQRLGRCISSGNEDMDFVCRAEECRTDAAELAGVGNGDDLLGLLDHLAKNENFFGLKLGDAALGVDAGEREEETVHVDVVEEVEGGLANEGKGPCPGHDTAGEEGADAGLVAEFHADIDGVSDDLEVLAVAEAAANEGGGGAGGEADGLVGLDEFCSGEADAALFRGIALLTGEERGIEAERLVEERLDEGCASVGATDEAAVLQARKIAADGRAGGTCDGEEFLDSSGAGAEEMLQELFGARA